MRQDYAEKLRRNTLRRERLIEILLTWPEHQPLCSMRDLGVRVGIPPLEAAHLVCNDLGVLADAGRIRTVSGTRSANRGHRAIQLPGGRVLATAGCPFGVPEAPK